MRYIETDGFFGDITGRIFRKFLRRFMGAFEASGGSQMCYKVFEGSQRVSGGISGRFK